jgi:hypothetical protein
MRIWTGSYRVSNFWAIPLSDASLVKTSLFVAVMVYWTIWAHVKVTQVILFLGSFLPPSPPPALPAISPSLISLSSSSVYLYYLASFFSPLLSISLPVIILFYSSSSSPSSYFSFFQLFHLFLATFWTLLHFLLLLVLRILLLRIFFFLLSKVRVSHAFKLQQFCSYSQRGGLPILAEYFRIPLDW